MSTNDDTHGVAFDDLQAPSQELTRAEATMVIGGGKVTDDIKKCAVAKNPIVRGLACFGVGYWIGTKLDEKFGISDWLADKAYDLLH